MFGPDRPLARNGPAFDEPWQAQVLALADTLIRGGSFSATNWAETLGVALVTAEACGAPDSTETYYLCVLAALETLTSSHTIITKSDLALRKSAWTRAYRATPHGQPVKLINAK